MKDKNLALKAAGIIFLVVSIAHLLRLLFKVRIIAGGNLIPMSASWIGFIFALLLGLWMYYASRD